MSLYASAREQPIRAATSTPRSNKRSSVTAFVSTAVIASTVVYCCLYSNTVWYGSGMVVPAWDEAGFTDMRSRLDKPVWTSSYVWLPGTIETDGLFLLWNEDQAWIPVKPPDDILQRFLKLSSGDSDEILQFARQYGVLLVSEDEDGTLRNYSDKQGKESLADWQKFSRKARAFLNLAADLSRGRPGELKDWEDLVGSLSAKFMAAIDDPLKARMFFERDLENWLRAAGITFGLSTSVVIGRPPRMEINYGGRVFGAIVFQLLLTITNSDSLYVCSGCGMPYVRPRGFKKPRPGEGNFCQTCGRTEALRQADIRRRHRIADAKRMHSAGRSPSEIAAELRTEAATVRGWIKKEKGKR